MCLKKYGNNNQRLINGIYELFKGKCLWAGDRIPTDEISFLNKELERHHLQSVGMAYVLPLCFSFFI